MKHIWAKSRLECAELMCVYVCVWAQALEEAAADAAEEEKRRLQTQTELQDRYRMDLEREKLVRLCHVQQQRSVLRHFLFLCVCVCAGFYRHSGRQRPALFSEELVLDKQMSLASF